MNPFLKKSPDDRLIKDIKKNKSVPAENINHAVESFPHIGNFLILGFLSLVIILLINSFSAYYKGKGLENDISEKAYKGISLLLEGGKQASKIQLSEAKQDFIDAEKNFSDAKNKAWFIKSDNSIYGKNNDVNVALNNLLDGGVSFANAGSHFLDAMDSFNLIPIYFVSKNKNPEKDIPSLTETLKDGLQKTDLAIAEIEKAAEKISVINENILPDNLKPKVVYAKEKIAEITQILNEIKLNYPALLKLLGDNQEHRYLILLQNNQEMRPTGGFIGSYALVNIKNGYIEKLETHDVYDLWGAGTMQIDPPDDLKLFTSNWRFRDANYSSDFPLSAEKLMWFLKLEGGVEVDTVIAINQGILRDMLAITGPIQVGNFGKLDSYNYDTVLSYVIESKMWGAEDPKHLLKVFVPAFAKEIMNEKYLGKVSNKLYRALQQKHILLYSKDPEVEALFDKFGFSGRQYMPKPKEDYISVINISSGGTKSDKFIEEKISHVSQISSEGQVINTVTIKRTHLYNDAIFQKWKTILAGFGITKLDSTVLDILGRGRNRDSIRVYVPKNSKLISSSDLDIQTKFDEELDKTYFFTTVEIYAGQSKEVQIKYSLPFTLDFDENNYAVYKLIAEKMPGHPGQLFTKILSTDKAITPILSYPDNLPTDGKNNIVYAKDLVYDRYFSALLKKENN